MKRFLRVLAVFSRRCCLALPARRAPGVGGEPVNAGRRADSAPGKDRAGGLRPGRAGAEQNADTPMSVPTTKPTHMRTATATAGGHSLFHRPRATGSMCEQGPDPNIRSSMPSPRASSLTSTPANPPALG